MKWSPVKRDVLKELRAGPKEPTGARHQTFQSLERDGYIAVHSRDKFNVAQYTLTDKGRDAIKVHDEPVTATP